MLIGKFSLFVLVMLVIGSTSFLYSGQHTQKLAIILDDDYGLIKYHQAR